MIKNILLSFIPIFVAVDAIGVMPIFVSLTEGMDKGKRYKIIRHSIITALGLAVGFIYLGKAIFTFLNITIGDFMIAGGVVLFCISIIDIINPTKKRRVPDAEMGAVPLGTPLIVGPAVLTTSLMIIGEYGTLPTLISVFLNVVLAGAIFASSDSFMRVVGVTGSRALSKVTSLLLAAIAVMMIRKGLFFILA